MNHFKDINIISFLRGQIIPIDLGCSQLCLENILFPFCSSQYGDEQLVDVLRIREQVLGYKLSNCLVSTPYHHYQQDPGNVEDWEMEEFRGWRMGRRAVKCSLLGTVCLLHLRCQSSYGQLHKNYKRSDQTKSQHSQGR